LIALSLELPSFGKLALAQRITTAPARDEEEALPMSESPFAPDHRAVISYNARLGGVLFLVYLLFYVGFIYLSAFQRDRMAADAVGGVNLAVVYGLGLIAAAFVMALLYMLLCRSEPKASQSAGDGAATENGR
jgi:uncharacterized membrane protein (DUF485 family)